jgi:ABC-type oligopeptide transport system substrate-binding subunit
MKKLYIILIAALLLTLAACLTACSAKPVSLRGTEAPNLPGPTNDALKVTDEGQDWNITLEQVDKETSPRTTGCWPRAAIRCSS